MFRKLMGLLGALTTLSGTGAATAAPAPADSMQVESYADLLKPIPNALALLQASDAAKFQAQARGDDEANVELAQYHHHHHHHHWRRSYHHHHHHHHHHWRRWHHHHHYY